MPEPRAENRVAAGVWSLRAYPRPPLGVLERSREPVFIAVIHLYESHDVEFVLSLKVMMTLPFRYDVFCDMEGWGARSDSLL